VKSNKIVFVFILSLFFDLAGLAQQEKRPLREILQSIEQQFTVSFTFIDETIEGVNIDRPPENLDLNEALEFLRQKTKLTFTQLDQRFITISKPVLNIPICGFIIDKETGEKVIGATIQCDNNFTTTDADGYFELPDLKEESILYIKSIGYGTFSIAANALANSPCKTLELSLQPSVLSEVIIANYLTTGIRKMAEGSFSIQTNELGILPGLTEPDVLFTVQSLPGIQSIDETVSNINVRGGTHDQNLLLWDGIKMYQQGHFFGLISAFSPYLTKEVTLIKNGTSVLFSDGVSSTIDIKSDDEVNKEFSGGAGLNMINTDIYAKIPVTRKSSLHVATRRSIADVIETPTYREYYDRAFRGTDVAKYNSIKNDSISTGKHFQFYDFSAKYLHDISDKDKLRVNFLQIHNSIDYTETETVNSISESKVSSLEQQNMAAGISYSRLWSAKVRTSGQWYMSRYDLEAVNFDILNDQRLIQDNEVVDMGIKLNARINLSNRVDLFSGYQFFEVGVSNLEDLNNPAFYRFKKTVLRTHILFAETNYSSPSANTNIRAGIRANLFTRFNQVRIEPRISINQKIHENLSLELLGEMKSQTITQVIDFQKDFLGVEKRRWIMANDQDIPIIKSKQLSAGVHFHKENFLIALEGYGKWVDDIITSSQGFQNQFQFVRSTGHYKTTGIDFLINRRVSKINSWISYSFAKSDFTFKELIPPGFPNNLDIRHRATWGISYQFNHIGISSGINWHTGKPFTEPLNDTSVVNGEIQYQSPNTSRLQNYWRLDISAKYKFSLSKQVNAITGISVWNALNNNNIVDAYYQVNDAGEITFSQRNALAFTPNIMFRVEF